MTDDQIIATVESVSKMQSEIDDLRAALRRLSEHVSPLTRVANALPYGSGWTADVRGAAHAIAREYGRHCLGHKS